MKGDSFRADGKLNICSINDDWMDVFLKFKITYPNTDFAVVNVGVKYKSLDTLENKRDGTVLIENSVTKELPGTTESFLANPKEVVREDKVLSTNKEDNANNNKNELTKVTLKKSQKQASITKEEPKKRNISERLINKMKSIIGSKKVKINFSILRSNLQKINRPSATIKKNKECEVNVGTCNISFVSKKLRHKTALKSHREIKAIEDSYTTYRISTEKDNECYEEEDNGYKIKEIIPSAIRNIKSGSRIRGYEPSDFDVQPDALRSSLFRKENDERVYVPPSEYNQSSYYHNEHPLHTLPEIRSLRQHKRLIENKSLARLQQPTKTFYKNSIQDPINNQYNNVPHLNRKRLRNRGLSAALKKRVSKKLTGLKHNKHLNEKQANIPKKRFKVTTKNRHNDLKTNRNTFGGLTERELGNRELPRRYVKEVLVDNNGNIVYPEDIIDPGYSSNEDIKEYYAIDIPSYSKRYYHKRREEPRDFKYMKYKPEDTIEIRNQYKGHFNNSNENKRHNKYSKAMKKNYKQEVYEEVEHKVDWGKSKLFKSIISGHLHTLSTHRYLLNESEITKLLKVKGNVPEEVKRRVRDTYIALCTDLDVDYKFDIYNSLRVLVVVKVGILS